MVLCSQCYPGNRETEFESPISQKAFPHVCRQSLNVVTSTLVLEGNKTKHGCIVAVEDEMGVITKALYTATML